MKATVDINNPSVLQQLYPDEILKSVYWTERGSKHIKQCDRDDSSAISSAIDQAVLAIVEADAILFVTGAGTGVDMGLPDFRSSKTFWKELAHPDISRYEDSSDNKWFDKDAEFAWGLNYYQIEMYRNAKIHSGYEVMRQIAALKNDNYFCFTTNIDGVLQRASFSQERVREVHGNIHRLQCTRFDCKDDNGIRDAWCDKIELEYDHTTYRAEQPLPKCYKCGGLARPNIWYCTDSQYVYWRRSMPISDAYHAWLDSLEGKKVVVIEVGAGLVIPSARVEAEDVAERFGGSLIRINPTDYMVPAVQLKEAVPSSDQLCTATANESKRQQEGHSAFNTLTESDLGRIRLAVGIPLGAKAALDEIWRRLAAR